jgi:uncharacterized membrane protein (UPF0127 family)
MPLAPSAPRAAHRRPILRPFVLAGAAALLFAAACGGGGEGGAGVAGGASETDEPSTAGPAAPATATSSTVPLDPVLPAGFTTVNVRVTEASGDVCEVCVWLADSADERGRGLMGVTDLDPAAGMLFVFPTPGIRSFYMFQTPTPLSIAWFGAGGSFVGEADMAPCLDVAAGECSRYAPAAEYTAALEVWDGGLDGLGIGAGSRLEIVAGSESLSCTAG